MPRSRFAGGAPWALALAASLAAAPLAAAPSATQLLDQMAARWNTITDYEVTVDSSSWSDGKDEKYRYTFAFRKPGMVKLRTLTGPDAGGELCVRPDGVIRGRKNSGLLKVFAITMSRNDKRLLNTEGVGVWEMDVGSEVRRLKSAVAAGSARATVTGPDASGAYLLSVQHATGKLAGMTVRYAVDAQSLWIERTERLRGTALVERAVYSGLRLNPGLPNKYFEF